MNGGATAPGCASAPPAPKMLQKSRDLPNSLQSCERTVVADFQRQLIVKSIPAEWRIQDQGLEAIGLIAKLTRAAVATQEV